MFLGSNSSFVGWEKSLKFLSTLEQNSSSYFLIHLATLVCYRIALISCLSEQKKKKVCRPLFQSIETVQKYNRIHAVMELAADLQQLLWGFYVPMVTAFRSHSAPKGLTWATGKVVNAFCPVTEWSSSEWNWKGFSRRWRLSLLNGFVLVGDSWRVGAALGVHLCCSHRLKAFPLLSFSAPALCMGWKAAWYCLGVNIHVSASAVLPGGGVCLPWVLGHPVMPVQKEKADCPPEKSPRRHSTWGTKVMQSTCRSSLPWSWSDSGSVAGQDSLAQGIQRK